MAEKNNKKRIDMMRIFVDAAYRITMEDSFDVLTVRSLAKETNYNNSTIYYYFQNFDYLQAYVSIRYLNEFFTDLWYLEQNYINGMDLFIRTLEILIKYIIKYPRLFKVLLLETRYFTIDELLDTYRCIYPGGHIREDSRFPIVKVDGKTVIKVLDICIQHGHIKAKSRNKIIELVESILTTLVYKAIDAHENEKADMEARFNEYVYLFTRFYKTPISILSQRTE